MKRILLTLLAVFATLSLGACGGDVDPPTKTTDTSDTANTAGDADTANDADTVPSDVDATPDLVDDVPDLPQTDQSELSDTQPPPDVDALVEVEEELPPSCPQSCPTNTECIDATLGCVCVAEASDCDADPTNGCDALNTPEHCGTCAPGALCDAFGNDGICVVPTPGEVGRCACLPTHLDLDGDTLTIPTNGCETGLVQLATQNLSVLNGTVVESTTDEAGQIFVAEVDGNVFVHAINVDATSGAASVGGSVDSGAPTSSSGAVDLAASNGIVALARRDAAVFLEYSAGSFVTVREHLVLDATSVAAVQPPQYPNSIAEFVAGGSGGVTWFAVFAQGSAPGALTCQPGNVGSTTTVCTVATLPTVTNVTRIATGDLGGSPWAVVLGSLMAEVGYTPALPGFDTTLVTGSTITGATDLAFFNGDSLLSVDGTALEALKYTLITGSPSTRAPLLTHTLGATASELALLDADRAAVATTAGLEMVHLLAAPTSAVLPGLDAAQGVVVSGNRVVVFDAGQVRVYELDLNAF